MKLLLSTVAFIFCCYCNAVSQNIKLISDCTVYFTLSVQDPKADQQVVKSMENTAQIVYIKGSKSRADFSTTGFKQTTLFNAKSDSIIILREIGNIKLISYLNSSKRRQQNKKYEGMQFTNTDDTKTILGYDCKRVVAKLADGSEYNVYFTPSITVSNKLCESQFKELPGFVLEYEAELENGKTKVTYTASKITFTPVPIAMFDLPKTGYRVL